MLSAKAIFNSNLSFKKYNNVFKFHLKNYVTEAGVISIGNVTKETKEPKRPEYIPKKYCE